MKWNRLFLSFGLALIIYIFIHILPLLSYLDFALISVIIFLDKIGDDGFYTFLIPISIFNDYSSGVYFGLSGLIFVAIFVLKLIVTDNMYFKSDFLRFNYYFFSVLLYNICMNIIINDFYVSIFIIPVHMLFDIGLIYLINSFLESRFALSLSK